MNECLPIEELAVLSELPADDPRRRHVESCASCRAAWLAYGDFAAPDPAVGGAGDAAVAALDATIAAVCAPAPRRSRTGWRVAAPLAAAAVLAVVLLGDREPALPPSGGSAVIRGAVAPSLRAAAVVADGSIELHWAPLQDARGYQVQFLAVAGMILAETPVRPDTSLVLLRDDLPPGLPPNGLIYWRVVARTDGGQIMSAPAALDLGRADDTR